MQDRCGGDTGRMCRAPRPRASAQQSVVAVSRDGGPRARRREVPASGFEPAGGAAVPPGPHPGPAGPAAEDALQGAAARCARGRASAPLGPRSLTPAPRRPRRKPRYTRGFSVCGFRPQARGAAIPPRGLRSLGVACGLRRRRAPLAAATSRLRPARPAAAREAGGRCRRGQWEAREWTGPSAGGERTSGCALPAERWEPRSNPPPLEKQVDWSQASPWAVMALFRLSTERRSWGGRVA